MPTVKVEGEIETLAEGLGLRIESLAKLRLGSGNQIGSIPLWWRRLKKETKMLRGLALWLLGIPIPIIILLWLIL